MHFKTRHDVFVSLWDDDENIEYQVFGSSDRLYRSIKQQKWIKTWLDHVSENKRNMSELFEEVDLVALINSEMSFKTHFNLIVSLWDDDGYVEYQAFDSNDRLYTVDQ